MNYIKILDNILEKNLDTYDVLTIINKDGVAEYTRRINNTFEIEQYDNERIGKNIFDTFEGLNEENSSVMQAIKSGKIQKAENQMLIAGDTRILVKGHSYPIFDESGQVCGAVDALKYLEIYNTAGDKEQVCEREDALNRIVSENRDMKNIKKSLGTISRGDSNVFLFGETGTGKGIFAKAIHQLSNRSKGPFISQNCAAIPPNLMESTFFGTEKGGFTGAESKKGIFELANHGTVFLDEINSMDLYMQSKLLSVFEERTIRRIGGQKNIDLDIRIISASNEPAKTLIEEGRMRKDFYYRISPVKIELPPLRERKEDILPLTKFFIDFFNERMNRNICGVTDMVLEALNDWYWPGNVRELKNIIENAFNTEKSDVITLNAIQGLFEEMEAFSAPKNNANKNQLTYNTLQAEPPQCMPERKGYNIAAMKATLEEGELNLDDMLCDIEKKIIESVMQENRKLKAVADKLGISPQKLNYKIQRLGIKR